MNNDASNQSLPELDPDEEFQVYAPKSELRDKAVTPSKGFSNERNAINRAERALEELSENFAAWMDEEVASLTQIRDTMKEEGVTDALAEELLICAHDLRGQAATLGFPSASELCKALCNLIEVVPDKTRIPVVIIDHYVNSVRAIVRENVTSENNMTAISLIKKLRSVTEEFVAHEIKTAAER